MAFGVNTKEIYAKFDQLLAKLDEILAELKKQSPPPVAEVAVKK